MYNLYLTKLLVFLLFLSFLSTFCLFMYLFIQLCQLREMLALVNNNNPNTFQSNLIEMLKTIQMFKTPLTLLL